LRRRIAFPLYESAANGVVLQLEHIFVAGQQMADHGVLVMEVTFRSVVDDVLERDRDFFFAELNFERLVRLVAQAVKKQWVDSGWFHTDQTCQSSSFRAVSLPCGTETAEQVDSKRGCLRELVCRQFRAALVEIVGNAHRADRVRA